MHVGCVSWLVEFLGPNGGGDNPGHARTQRPPTQNPHTTTTGELQHLLRHAGGGPEPQGGGQARVGPPLLAHLRADGRVLDVLQGHPRGLFQREELQGGPGQGDYLWRWLCCVKGLGFGRTDCKGMYWHPPTHTHTPYPTIHPRAQHKPQFLVAVPRLFETIYRGVQQKFATEKGVKKGLISFFTKVNTGGGWVMYGYIACRGGDGTSRSNDGHSTAQPNTPTHKQTKKRRCRWPT